MRSQPILLAVALIALSGVVLGERVQFRGGAPAGWRAVERVKPTQTIHLTFALKQRNLDTLESLFWEVSNPESERYAHYLSADEIQGIVAPSSDTVQTVTTWLAENNVAVVSSENVSADYLKAAVPATVAENLLNCKFWFFIHEEVGQGLRIIRAAGNYSVPAAVAKHLDFVSGVSHFPSVKPLLWRRNSIRQAVARAQKIVDSGKDLDWSLSVDPSFLRTLYNVGNVQSKSKANSQSCAQFLEQYYSNVDLEEFFLLFWRNSIGQSPNTVGPNPTGAGTEASLDIEYLMAMGSHVNTTFWSNSGRENNQEPFLQWMMAVNTVSNPPLVFSVSYGDDEDTIPLAYTYRLNTEFQKAALRGISILFASGDDGVGSTGKGCKQFVPNYPASSPYVTAVGGTQSDGIFETGNEVVASLSGGGFSNYFERPAYQEAAVQQYLTSMASKLPDPSKWNASSRAYPDVSAQAMDYVIVINLVPLPGVAGTSCATPVFSGIVSLLNDIRLQNNKRPLGFLNPLFYQMAKNSPATFNDITKGSNPACGTSGFEATTGWDPSSGLGSPNYAEMAKYIAQLP